MDITTQIGTRVYTLRQRKHKPTFVSSPPHHRCFSMSVINYVLLLCFTLALPTQKVKVSLSLGKHFISCCCHSVSSQQEQRQTQETGDRLLPESRHTVTPSSTQICLSSVLHKTPHTHTQWEQGSV